MFMSLRSIAIKVFRTPVFPKPKNRTITMTIDFIMYTMLSIGVMVSSVFMFIPEAPPFSGNTMWDILFWVAATVASAVAVSLAAFLREIITEFTAITRANMRRRAKARAQQPRKPRKWIL